MVYIVEILEGRLGQRSVERVRYVINNLLHLVIVKYGDISLLLCISTRLQLVSILSLLVKYLVIFHADPCNKSYWASIASPTLGCSIEISRDWASEASPTLGCSIEISRDIYMYTQTPLIRTPLIRALPSTGQGSRQNCLYIHTCWNSVAQLATAIMAALPEQLQGQLHFITRLGPRIPASCNYC